MEDKIIGGIVIGGLVIFYAWMLWRGAEKGPLSAEARLYSLPDKLSGSSEEKYSALRGMVAYALGVAPDQVTHETVLDASLSTISLNAAFMFSRSIILNEGDTFGDLAEQCFDAEDSVPQSA